VSERAIAPAVAPRLFLSEWEDSPAWLPRGVSVWAIGDVHGHLAHLDALLSGVTRLMDAAPAAERHLITLGDYIDRGPANIATLLRVASLAPPGVEVTRLRGNHEEFLAKFLNEPDVGEGFLDFWMANGGLATLMNLGVSLDDLRRLGADAVIDRVRRTASKAVHDALSSLVLGRRLGGYLFVHAGIHPVNLAADGAHLKPTTIREPFLSAETWAHDFVVVHGHSIVGPDIEPHRIAVDSGCYYTGVLTCVELRDRRARFLCATRDESLDGLRKIRARRALSEETWRPY
jgi:serine/threonine protein phosphatase 1